MTRFPRPSNREERRSIERSIEQSIFQAGDFGYAAADVTIVDSESVDLECDFNRQLHLFDLRNCIKEQASREKLHARFGFGGEIQITGLTGDVELTDCALSADYAYVLARTIFLIGTLG